MRLYQSDLAGEGCCGTVCHYGTFVTKVAKRAAMPARFVTNEVVTNRAGIATFFIWILVHVILYVSPLCVCVRACVRACVRPCVRACVCACVNACVRTCVRACVCDGVSACVKERERQRQRQRHRERQKDRDRAIAREKERE